MNKLNCRVVDIINVNHNNREKQIRSIIKELKSQQKKKESRMKREKGSSKKRKKASSKKKKKGSSKKRKKASRQE